MSGYETKSGVVKRSVSFSALVNEWAEELATQRGYSNFSAFLADLIREQREIDKSAALKDSVNSTSPAPGASELTHKVISSYRRDQARRAKKKSLPK